MARPTSLAEVALRRSRDPARPLAKPLGEFLDAFYEPQAAAAAMLAKEPDALIARDEAAYLAAVAEHLSGLYGFPAPSWVNTPRYFLDVASWPDSLGRSSETIHFAESPVAFRRRFIFTEGWPLRRKHGPHPAAG